MKKMVKVSGAPATALLLLVSTPYIHAFTATEPDSKVLGAAAPTIDQVGTNDDLDRNGDGLLDLPELRAVLEALKITVPHSGPIGTDEAAVELRKYDIDGSGKLDRNEFSVLFTELRGAHEDMGAVDEDVDETHEQVSPAREDDQNDEGDGGEYEDLGEDLPHQQALFNHLMGNHVYNQTSSSLEEESLEARLKHWPAVVHDEATVAALRNNNNKNKNQGIVWESGHDSGLLNEMLTKLGAATQPGQTMTHEDLQKVVDWAMKSRGITEEPACYRYAKDRGVGIVRCGSNRVQRGALCYDKCKNNYNDRGWMVHCEENCQSGWRDTGLFCSSKRARSYVDWWKRCKGGYHKVVGVCWLNHPWDKAKRTQNRGVKGVTCGGSHPKEISGLCYKAPPTGYECQLTACQQICPQGLVECGLGMCASSSEDCVSSIVGMVMSPAMVVVNVVTFGTGSGATKAVSVAARVSQRAARIAQKMVNVAKKMASFAKQFKKFEQTASKWQERAEALNDMKADFDLFVEAMEQDIGGMTNQYVQDQLEKQPWLTGPNKRAVAACISLILAWEVAAGIDPAEIAAMTAEMADPTGLVAVFNSFNNDMCSDHPKFPTDLAKKYGGQLKLGCSTALNAGSWQNKAAWGMPRYEDKNSAKGAVVCCYQAPHQEALAMRKNKNNVCLSGTASSNGNGRKTYSAAEEECKKMGAHYDLCSSQSLLDSQCGKGCYYDHALVWTK